MSLLLRISAPLLFACATLLAEDSPARPLDAFSYDQLRMFLKGYNGDWRLQSDREKGIPAPPATKFSPAKARGIALPKPATRSVDFKTLLQSRRSVREFSKDPMPLADLGFLL